MNISKLRDKIAAKAGGTHVSILSQSDIAASKEWIPTPAYDLNRIISGSIYKGFPNKTFTLFVGPETSGKSSLICLSIAEAQRQGYTPIIIDTEGGWDTKFVKRWGMDADKMIYAYCPFVSKASVILSTIIDEQEDKKEKYALAIDSIGGFERLKILDDARDKNVIKADQGRLQKDIKQMLKLALIVCKSKNSIGFGAGHYYGDPSGYGDPEKIGGGKAAKLLPDIIVSLKKYKIYENPKAKGEARGKVLGTNLKAISLKNRYYPPFGEADVEINYRSGINSYAGLTKLAIESEYIIQNGSWYTFQNGEKIQGADKLELLLKDDNIYLKFLEKWLESTGYSSINLEIKEANELLEDAKEKKK